jgi:viroplasmin and RNaseH domain-containing protein
MPYVVYKGRVPGAYVRCKDCLKQVNKFKGNNYKWYMAIAEAEARWMNHLREERRTTFGVTTAVLLTAVIVVLVYFIVI